MPVDYDIRVLEVSCAEGAERLLMAAYIERENLEDKIVKQ